MNGGGWRSPTFRPGGAVGQGYRQVEDRGNLASDYIVSGAHVIGSAANRKRDCLLAVMNIEFEDENHGHAAGCSYSARRDWWRRNNCADFPPLACRHMLLSELFPGVQSDPAHPFTVRMQVANAMMIVSALHLDYERRDLALEHGSDRHSTFQDFKC